MSKLQRHIGLFALTLYGVGDILGSGIYGLVGKAAGQLGNFVWLAFLVSFLLALLTGLSYAALGARFPRAAGSSFVIWKAFRIPFIAFVAGMATMASGLTSMAAAANIFSGYLNGMLDFIPVWIGILGFVLCLSGIVFAGIKESMWANTVCTVIEVTGLLLIIAAGIPFIGQVDLLDVKSIPNASVLTPTLVLSGAVLTFYSFVGFEDLINVSEEVIKPKRTVPLALMTAMLVASVIYMLVAIVAVSVVPADQLASSKEPLVDVMRVAWPWFPSNLFSVIALFAVTNTALLNFVMASRLMYGLGNLGLLPKFVSRVHGRTKTPYIAVMIVFVMFLALALVGNVASLARATSLFVLLVFMCMNASLFVFQREDRMKKRRITRWRIPQLIPVLGVIGTIAMMAHANFDDFKIAGSLLLVIVVLYFVQRPTAEQIQKFESATDPE
jgi:basic amino acid/polyamine antiporter, APA family